MIRKHATTTLLAFAMLQASLVQALGLGDISLRSSLDQPLSAEIRLRGVGDLDASQIIVKLASQTDFERAGVDRLFFLGELRFDLQLSGGDALLRVTTERPVREPYLDFIVEARWPNGRVLREYTVLLDLPTYQRAALPAVRAPAAPAARSATSTAPMRGEWSGNSYTVARNDTLWGIASRARPQGVSIQRMMVAIHRDNPAAFIRGNINLLKAGQVLRIPAAADIAGLSQADAASTVSEHNREWRAGDTTAHEPAASAEAAPAASAAGDEDAYLRLAGDSVEDASGSSAAGGSGGTVTGGSQEQLAQTEESLSAAERANAELKARVAALEEQVQDYERLVELKSDGLSSAQAGTDAPVEAAAAPETPAATAEVPASPETPVASEPAQSLVDRLLGNTMVLAGGAGVALIAMLAFLFTRRRRDSEMPVPAHELRKAAAQAAAAAAPQVAAQRSDLERDDVAEKALFGAPARVKAVAAGDQEIADPVSEADIYIAYGKPQTAIELLGKALVQHPDRSDVRLKLMDILAEQGNASEFIAEFDRLEALGDKAALRAARELLEDTDRAHWLLEIDGQPATGVDATDSAEPGLVTAELDIASPQLDAPADEGEEDLSLELELGELESGAEEARAPAELDLVADEPARVLPAGEHDDELDLLPDSDEVETKLELARAYMDMGDMDGARDILEEVVAEGAQYQREQASKILDTLRAG
ncbi:MAG: FimV family protein [Gammaproteobacteria bacterium]|nr:FimV family protein [Gammaproteobacteria bacterium]